MKIIKYSVFAILFSYCVYAQSIVVGSGSLIEVGNGSDICSGVYGNITGEIIGGGTQCNELPLPVELALFTATLKNNKVDLFWKTETETNNYGFEIERKVIKPQSSISNWVKIGFVEGSGNSNSPKEYSFTDDKLLGGKKFSFRLKQIDNDGQFEYSDVVEVEVVPDRFELMQNFPNPFNPSTKIIWQTPVSGHQSLIVYDVLGNEVATLIDEYKEAGNYEVEFNPSTIKNQLSSSIYFYKIQTGEFKMTKKMIYLK